MNFCNRRDINIIARSEAPSTQDVPVISNVSDVQRLFDYYYGATKLDSLNAHVLQLVISSLKFYQCNNHLRGLRNDNGVSEWKSDSGNTSGHDNDRRDTTRPDGTGQGPHSTPFHRGITHLTNHGKNNDPRPDIAPHYNDVPYVNRGFEFIVDSFMQMVRDNVFLRYGGKMEDWEKVSARGFLYHAPSGMGQHYDSSGDIDKNYIVPRLVLSMGSARKITYTIHEFTKETKNRLSKAVSPGIVRPTCAGAHAYICHPSACGKSAIAWKDAEHLVGYVVQHEVAKLRGTDTSVNLIFDLPLTQAGTMQLIRDINASQFSLLSTADLVGFHPRPNYTVKQIENWAQTLTFVPLPDTVMCGVCSSRPAYTYTKPAEGSTPNSYVLTHCVKCASHATSNNPTVQFLTQPCSQLCGKEREPLQNCCRECLHARALTRKCADCDRIGCEPLQNCCRECLHARALTRKCADCDTNGCEPRQNCCRECLHARALTRKCADCGAIGCSTGQGRCNDCLRKKRAKDKRDNNVIKRIKTEYI